MKDIKYSEKDILVSILLPCLNEEKAVGKCIKKAQEAIKKLDVNAEIIVIDNGSIDKSAEIAESSGAQVVFEPKKGYGSAYRKGFQVAKGKYIIMADADDTYDLSQTDKFLKPMLGGFDFVMGSRFKGRIFSGAMPWAHRYLGNPILTAFLKYLFHTRISDAHCGMRAITKEAYEKFNLVTTGMEFASEMTIAALKNNLKITEVPVNYYRRKGKSKLIPLKDAWRHIRFMLLFSPTHLFLIPGLSLFFLGIVVLTTMLFGPLVIAGRAWDIHFMVVSSLLSIFGFQILNLGFYARTYALTQRFVKEDKAMNLFWRFFNLEKGLILGLVIFATGCGINIFILFKWISSGFGSLNEVRRAIFALTLTIIGAQTIFSSFFLSILGIQKTE